jgi:hypothetical protein
MHSHGLPEPTAALYVLYVAATYSNLGPMFAYSVITWSTLGGISLPGRVAACARLFLMACAATHIAMMVMLIAMPAATFHTLFWRVLLAAHLVLNLTQLVAALVVANAISKHGIRSIRFAPMGEVPPSADAIRRRLDDRDVAMDERGREQSRRGKKQDQRGEDQDRRGEGQDRHGRGGE